jgi:SNF2 family DNA or RNA helicase
LKLIVLYPILQIQSKIHYLDFKAAKNIGQFALILTHHRLWGSIILPYIINNASDKSYFCLSECLLPYQSDETLSYLTDEERELVRITNEYSDRNLFRFFSKESSVKDFLASVTLEKIEKFIRPYIERRMYKCLTIARNEAIPCFFQKTKSDILHTSDQLLFCVEPALPVFRFDRNNEQIYYSLKIEAEDQIIELKDKPVDILCMSPCLIRKSDRIFFISDIDGLKLRPFLTKEHILIPPKSELKYFSGFVLNAVSNYKVEGSGIEIIITRPDKKALLSLENGFKGTPVLILQFCYSGNKIFARDADHSFTSFESNAGNYIYRKYFRDFQWEARCREKLGEMGFFSDDEIHYNYNQISNARDEDSYTLIEAVNSNYSEIIESDFVLTSKLNLNYNLKPVKIEISSQIENDWFDLRAIIKIGDWEIPFINFERNILEGIREYELPDGSLAILPESWFPEYRSLFEFGKVSGDSLKIHKQHFSLLSSAIEESEPEGYKKLKKLLNPEKLQTIQPPAGLKCEMRKYQIDGLNWLYWLQTSGLGGCLADDMGLGKTVQSIALLQYNIENLKLQYRPLKSTGLTLFDTPQQRHTSLIIVPASLVYNWQNEIKRFAPRMKVLCYTGTRRKKALSLFHTFDIILSSYHTIRQDIDTISSFMFLYIILDESQLIKNPASLLFKSVISLKSEFKLVLTGTPIENSLTDLWTQMNFINPGLLGNLNFFRREYSNPIDRNSGEDKELKLRKIIRPFILRRTKEMVANDLPPVSEQTVFCDMTDEQAKIYDEEKSAVRNIILKSMGDPRSQESSIALLQGLMRLRQISNHPVMVHESYSADSGKFETVLQNIESVLSEGHKILIFSSFVKHLNLFAEALAKKRITFSMLTGASTNREKIVSTFQNDPLNVVFLISIKSGGLGLNLTAADYVFILDPWWNPATELQARNRAHRIGQGKSVFVYRYISTGTLEEKIIKLQEKKSKLAESFVRSNNPLKYIEINQILELIN